MSNTQDILATPGGERPREASSIAVVVGVACRAAAVASTQGITDDRCVGEEVFPMTGRAVAPAGAVPQTGIPKRLEGG